MGTPHNEANIGDIAELVLMPGDPLRAKLIAEKYLTDAKQINSVRNMLGYTGYYKDKKITVMGSGMGMPSIGIYSYELFEFYGVKKIIRIGSCGAYSEDVKIYDIILADRAYTESNFAYTLDNSTEKTVLPSEELIGKIENAAKDLNTEILKGTIMTSDCFDYYMTDWKAALERVPKDIRIIGAEMEAFALFYIAKLLGKEAACLVTVVDNHATKEEISSESREKSLNTMIELALEAI